MTVQREIAVVGQGKIVVTCDPAAKLKKVELGIESPCCSCVAPVFRLSVDEAYRLQLAVSEAIIELGKKRE